MKEVIVGLGIGLVISFLLSPYFSLWNLWGIHDELRKIREQLEKKERKQDNAEIH